MPKPLTVTTCRDLCDWLPNGETREGDLVFACAGCGSEWVRTEGWRPKNLDGTIAKAVQEELER